MILPLIIGYMFGKFVNRRFRAIAFGVLLGAALGLVATYTLIPLLYPIFTGDAGLVVIPEFDSIGIMFLTSDFVIYTETVYFLTRSYIIDLVLVFTGALFAALGVWIGSTRVTKKPIEPFEEI